MLDHIPRWLIPKLVIPVYMKVIVLIVFAGYMGASVYGITQMEEGLNLKQLVADDSYYMEFVNLQERHFPYVIPMSIVFESPLTYSDSTVQGQIETLLQNVKSEPTMKDDFEIHWLRSYQQYAGYDESNEAAFISGLKSFLNMTSNKRFENDIVFDDTRNLITYSRVYVMSVSIKDSQEQGNFMSRMREVAAESSLPVFVHSVLFVFFEQYNAILPQTLQTVGVAIVAVLIVTCIFMPHPLMIAFITITVIMITTGIFGFHYYIDRTLSSITSTLIIMSVGFSVDFSAHICHGYMISSGRDRNERTRNAILRSGAPIFHGAMSTLIGMSVLAAGRSFTSITFFKVMIIVLVFAIVHALLLLPVILSLFGPNPSENKPRPVAAKNKKHYARRKHIEQDMRVSNSSYKASPFIVNPQLYSHPPRYGYPYYSAYASQAPHENDAPPRYGYPYYPTDAGQAPHENDAPPRYGYPYYSKYASKAPHENDAPWLSYRHWYPAQYYPNWPNYQQYS